MTNFEKTLLKSIFKTTKSLIIHYMKAKDENEEKEIVSIISKMTSPIAEIIKKDKLDIFADLLMNINTPNEELIDFVVNNREV